MKKIENLFIGISLLTVLTVTAGALWYFDLTASSQSDVKFPETKYGAFLAGQHAIYVNDFDSAAEFSKNLTDKDLPVVSNIINLSDFLSGKLPENIDSLKNETSTTSQFMYDAHLLKNNDWAAVYARHKKDDSALVAPLRIWSGVATGKTTEVLKFVDDLKTHDSWKDFVRGQIYAETGNIESATKHFTKVSIDFMNLSDYLYMMAFFRSHGKHDIAETLRLQFTARPGGLFMLNNDNLPKWEDYSGFHGALVFSMVQNVSHTQIMMFSDLSVLMLRFSEIINDNSAVQKDAINYYLGQYFFNTGGDCEKYFKAVPQSSPFYSFSLMKIAEKTGKNAILERAISNNPLFVPAIAKLVANHVQNGEQRKALKVVNRALDSTDLTGIGRAFFLKTRAQIYLTFGNMDKAQTDIRAAANILPMDAGVLSMQSKIWIAQKRELDVAYEYATALIRKSPTDIEAWDILGMAVWAKEGPNAALELLERVGQVSNTCSVLFEHLGDLYIELGDKKLARDAYQRAISLSGDGLTIVPKLEKKLRKIR